MYDSAERGARFAERHLVPLYPCRTSRRRGILHRTLFRSLRRGSFASMTARFARDRDRDARALRFEHHSTRARLYRALTLLAPFVSLGSVEHDAIYPVRTQMPTRVAWPEVGGIIPPRGPLLPPYTGPRPHPCPNGYQGPQASVFPDARPQLAGYMGNFYEDYYGDGDDDE